MWGLMWKAYIVFCVSGRVGAVDTFMVWWLCGGFAVAMLDV